MTISDSSAAPFRRIHNTDLDPVAVVAQCLDNQWVPRDLLKPMMEHGWSLNDPDVARQRLNDSRHEYLRSILNSQQVIINRAFFFNNPVVYRDILHSGDSREAFTSLLKTSVLVPFLLRETSPVQEQIFTVQPQGWDSWRQVARESSSSCLRLSWDEDENEEFVHSYMETPFRRFLLTMAAFDVEGLKRDFDLDDDQARGLQQRMRQVSVWAAETEDVRRETFYEKFVVADGTRPPDGRYDRDKPFAAELKQLADLRYNTTLADAVDRYALTPVQSLHRAALQEERQLAQITGVDTDTLLEVLLRRRVFDLAQQPLDVGFTDLELHHVWRARRTDEWVQYINSLKSLIAAPREFDERAQEIYSRYVDLAARLGSIVGERRKGVVDRWQPVIQVTIEVLGSVISIVFGHETYAQVVGNVARSVAGRASTAIVRFAVIGRDERRARAQLGTSVDLMRLRFQRTAAGWEDLQRQLQSAGLPLRALTREPEADANLDVPEEHAGA
jgi:hypothetical protein